MRLFLLGAAVALAIFSGFFLRARQRAWTDEQTTRAREALVGAPVVAAAHGSSKRPWLMRRSLVSSDGTTRALGPEDRLAADAAAAVERDGAVVQFLDDGRILAAAPAPGGVAVAVVAPSGRPASFPFLYVALALLAGAVLARTAGPLYGVLPFAVLAALTSLWAAAAIVAAVGLLALADARGVFAALRRHRVAYGYLLPAALGMLVLVVVPFAIGCVLGFYDHHHGTWQYVGWKNFATILGGDGRSLDDPLSFWFTLAVTIAWTAVNVALHVTIGVALALALREPWVKLRALWRVLLILPWAVPSYITALIWKGMFQQQFGAVNALLRTFGISEVSWFSKLATAFCANVTTNTWLGFPFMMVVALGALQAIPREHYEAAEVDGAGPWQRFWYITLPGLKPSLMPAVVLGSIWTFNMFNVIFLVSGGRPGGATDILVTQAYRWAFERGQRYGMAAAYATLIFLILAAWTFLVGRRRKARS